MNQFTFSKKSGWLFIKFISSNEIFSYHRKTTTILNDNLQWEKSIQYYIKEENVKVECSTFEGVIERFSHWLKHI